MATREAWLKPRTVSDGQTREDTRLALSGGWTPTGALTARSGVAPGGGFDLVGTGAMTFTIGTGRAYVQGTTAQGAYPVYVDAAVTFTAVDGHATNPRIDLYVLRVYDTFIDSSGSTLSQIERVAGTAGAVPVAPSVPAGSIPLWELRVPAGASAGGGGIQSSPGWATARTDRRYYTAAAGGIVPSGGPSWSGVYDGQYRDNPTTGRPERWSTGTSAWVDVMSGVAWGRVGYAYQGVGTGAIGQTTTLLDDLDFTATMRTNRRYSIQLVVCWLADDPGGRLSLTARYVAGTSINTSGTGTTEAAAMQPYASTTDQRMAAIVYAEINGPLNGSVTWGGFAREITTHAIALAPDSGHSLSLHDIGPAI